MSDKLTVKISAIIDDEFKEELQKIIKDLVKEEVEKVIKSNPILYPIPNSIPFIINPIYTLPNQIPQDYVKITCQDAVNEGE